MTLAELGGFLAGLATLGTAIYAAVQSHRTKKREDDTQAALAEMAKERVDIEAFGRAKGIYLDALRQLEAQVQELKTDLIEEKSTSLRLRRRVEELENVVAVMRQRLLTLGVDLASIGIDLRDEVIG